MNQRHGALAVFVKTPGLSPVKTRLAKRLGHHVAQELYRLATAAVEAAMAQLAESDDICPYWAVAEEAGLAEPRWQRFQAIPQGAGDLGDRLGRVFSELGQDYEAVVAIGADSPQITPQLLREAFRILLWNRGDVAHVLGRCHDGGFYLVGTNITLAPTTWQDVPYGTSHAADRLAANLASQGQMLDLPRLTDVDRPDDLPVLQDELAALAEPSPAQSAVLAWVTDAQRLMQDGRHP